MHGRAHSFGKRKRRKEVATYGKLGYDGGWGRRAGNEERDLPFKGKEGGPEHFGLSKLVIFERLLRLRNAMPAPLPSLFPSPKRGCFVRPSVRNGHTPSSPPVRSSLDNIPVKNGTMEGRGKERLLMAGSHMRKE